LAEAQVSDKAHCTFIRNAVQQAEMAGEKVKKDYLDFIYCKNENVIKVFHSLAEVTGLIGYYNCLQPGHRKNALSMYLFAIHTGLRWSDVCGLKWVNISVNEIDFSSQKGKRNNTLYMPAMAIDILSQQDNGSEYCFPKRSRQRTSYLIKKICEDLKFNDQIEKVWFRGNTRHSKVYKKWELVSFHTARHTYAVLSIKLGVDLVTLQDNMGHSDPKTTRIYAKLTEKDRTQRTANAWDKLSLGEHKAE
jgi:integrase